VLKIIKFEATLTNGGNTYNIVVLTRIAVINNIELERKVTSYKHYLSK